MTEAIDVTRPQGLAPTSFDGVWAMAERLAGAKGFIPKDLLGNPGGIAACILTGLELGLGPMESLRSVYVLDGRPMLSADLMLKLALRAGVRAQWTESSDTAARLRLTREGHGHHEHAFTLDEAKRAGLLSKSNWRSYPAAMLRARCLSAAMRAFCPDVLGSGVYVEGEIEGDRVIDATPKPVDHSAALAKAKLFIASRHLAGTLTDRVLDGAIRRCAELGIDEATVRSWVPTTAPAVIAEPPVFADLLPIRALRSADTIEALVAAATEHAVELRALASVDGGGLTAGETEVGRAVSEACERLGVDALTIGAAIDAAAVSVEP